MATALWPEALRSEKTLRNRMHELRRAIGGRVSLGPGWAFDDTVTTDWAQFQALARGSLEDQQHALDLVRGQPLHDVKGDWTSLEGFEAEMEAAIVDLAIDVSEKLLADGDPDAATRAAKAGLRACPWEERLYQSAMRAAADRGAIGEVKTLYNELRAPLDIEDDDEPDPETQFLYEELLQTARRVSTSTE
jgi:DNA-binding SARP family transcriptional activator